MADMLAICPDLLPICREVVIASGLNDSVMTTNVKAVSLADAVWFAAHGVEADAIRRARVILAQFQA